MMTMRITLSHYLYVGQLLFLCLNLDDTAAFHVVPSTALTKMTQSFLGTSSTTALTAAAKKAKKARKNNNKNTNIKGSGGSTSGFGGAAVEPCPCGSGHPYNKCCGLIHGDTEVYANASASQVVRSRYSAYAKRQYNFVISSTHPLNSNFIDDIQHWKETIEQNSYDNFMLNKCEILDESYEGEGDDEIGTVRFLAHLTQRDTGEKTAFIETSTFERDSTTGAWLYRDGVVENVDAITNEA